MNVDDVIDNLKSSKCFTCKHRISKVIKPLTMEDFEFLEDTLDTSIDIEDFDDYDIEIEIHRCMLTDDDISYQVLECNKYESEDTRKLIRDNRFV
jgi:hypothetical protein